MGKEIDKLIAAFEKSAEDWPWRGRELVTLSCTMEKEHASLIEAFGFDDPLKRGLFLVLILSRSLRLSGKLPVKLKSPSPRAKKSSRPPRSPRKGR